MTSNDSDTRILDQANRIRLARVFDGVRFNLEAMVASVSAAVAVGFQPSPVDHDRVKALSQQVIELGLEFDRVARHIEGGNE